MSRIDDLADRLRTASEAYYNGGTPIMSDADFDTLEAELRSLDPHNAALLEVGSPVGNSGWPKRKHLLPVGSLNKAQNPQDMDAWFQSTGVETCISEKLDGISIVLTYSAETGTLLRAVTRGDGHTGEDITRNVRVMKGVPEVIPNFMGFMGGKSIKERVIRGEIVCLHHDFKSYFPGESNPRNTASGTAKRQTGWQKCRHLTVFAYNIMDGISPMGTRAEELQTLKEWGFRVPNYRKASTIKEVHDHYDHYVDRVRAGLEYDIDGLVVEINSTNIRLAAGKTPDGLRPKGAIAYKFPHDSAQTKIRDIVWQTGPSGRVTPVAVFDEVELAGAKVTRASLHNPDYIAGLYQDANRVGIAEGDFIMVSRRNDVIPAVERIVKPDDDGHLLPALAAVCPACGAATERDGAYLVCPNEDGCPAQVMGSLRRWVKKIGVLHFGDSLLKAVVEAGLVTKLSDLYRLEEDAVAALELDGRRVGGAAKRALDSLHAHKELTLATFVGSLGIPLCGRRMVSMLVDGGLTDLGALSSATEAQLAAVPGFGAAKATAFREGFDARKRVIVGLQRAGVKILPHVAAAPATGGLSGTVVCFTGVRNKALEADITALGGTVKSSLTKDVTVLVAKDVNSTSSKAQTARMRGVEIIDVYTMTARVQAAQ